jgi:hypothetical protein
MRISVNKSRWFLLFWFLLQVLKVSSGNISFTPVTPPLLLAEHPVPFMAPQLQSHLYSPETLLLPDALVNPVPVFQFGFVESLACLLFVLFCLYVPVVIKETVHFFANSYLHTLFSSLILINAP